ncbi:MAG: hypothetical protein QOE00_2829, partial [Ilumatobacteraceae bacterium]
NCASATKVTVDTALDTGQFSSLVLAGGLPIISYYDGGNLADNLKLAHCLDATCTTKTITSVYTTGITGLYTSIEMSAGLPTIAFYDASTERVMVKRCVNLDCTGGTAPTAVVTTTGVSEQHLSLAIDASGFPVISYLDPGLGLVAIAHCVDATCTGAPSEHTLADPSGPLLEPVYSSIVLGNGIPTVSYYDSGSDSLRVGRCIDATCVDTLVSIADQTNGAYTSIALGTDGYPVISSYDQSLNRDLVITRCVDPFCSPRRIRSLNG